MEKLKSILIVDDVETNRAILNEMFYHTYQVLEAENGKQALEIIEKNKDNIGIILLDIIMPELDGFGVLEKMNENNLIRQIPVIVITGEQNENVEQKGYDLGVSDVIQKPFNVYVTQRRVQNVVDLYLHKNNLEHMVKEQTQKIEKQAKELEARNDLLIDTLSTVVEFRDLESGQHIKRIRFFTRILLDSVKNTYQEYKLNDKMIEIISSASALHDVGKIAIPDSILLKPGRLTNEEFEIMKQHTVKGCSILEKLDSVKDEEFYKYAYDICCYHHERWDGRGYPKGLKEDEVPIWAQVVAVADVYDALVSERVYKAAYTHEEAVNMILNGECGNFSPKLLNCFKSVQEKFKKTYESL